MNLTRASISNPVAVIAAVLLKFLMGSIGLLALPIQMIPDIQRPFIQINTGWRTAVPEEVESEILEPQEVSTIKPFPNSLWREVIIK